MENFLRIILPLYFVTYFGIAFVAKSIITAKRIGKNPLVLPKDDSAYGLIGQYFKLILVFMFIYAILFSFFPAIYEYFLPIKQLSTSTIQYVGLALLALALVWTIIAQSHMLADILE